MKKKTLDRIYLFLSGHPKSTVGEVAKGCDLSYNTTLKYLAWMFENEMLQVEEFDYRKDIKARHFAIKGDLPQQRSLF